MKPLSILLLATTVSAATAAATTALVGESSSDSSRSSANNAIESSGLSALESRLNQLAAENETLRAQVTQLSMADPSPAPARRSAADVEATLERLLAERGLLQVDAPAGEDSTAIAEVGSSRPGKVSASTPPDEILAMLVSDQLTGIEREEYWQEIREAGLLDDVVALFEERAERDPNNPEAQVELGAAYLQKIFEVGEGPLAGVWATKADKTFDAALALDDHHWEARFNKAASLSFWPPIFGKQNEAISHFETLIEQQQSQGSTDPKHAEAYLYLGNLHLQKGDQEAAMTAWRNGTANFPEHAGLLEQIRLAAPK